MSRFGKMKRCGLRRSRTRRSDSPQSKRTSPSVDATRGYRVSLSSHHVACLGMHRPLAARPSQRSEVSRLLRRMRDPRGAAAVPGADRASNCPPAARCRASPVSACAATPVSEKTLPARCRFASGKQVISDSAKRLPARDLRRDVAETQSVPAIGTLAFMHIVQIGNNGAGDQTAGTKDVVPMREASSQLLMPRRVDVRLRATVVLRQMFDASASSHLHASLPARAAGQAGDEPRNSRWWFR